MGSILRSFATTREETGRVLKARHVTSEREYRNPLGAVQLGGTVQLSIDVWDDDVTFCTLHVWTDAEGAQLIEMRGQNNGGRLRFSASYKPTTTGVVWYSFAIEASDGSVWRYGAREGWTTGEGAFAYGEPPSFQITVYTPRAIQPDWYRQGVTYQIFPDRFARDEAWEERAEAALAGPHEGIGRKIVEEWDTPPVYDRNPDGTIANWDFYGGSLVGIREKLDYLENLGVTTIYLNPIFQAGSAHRYDTADYMKVDPMLGNESDLRALCVDAEERGMYVILDGVFNHCGCDSRYFNRWNNFDEKGAWQGEDSPYRDWFCFNANGIYSGWWGDQNLPDLNEDNPDFREFICGKDGVVRRWMRAGVRGWRLDVVDELSDEFVADIKRAILTERPDALLIGEVWEDASNKTAYGKLRHYFQGAELDGTMNYPFRTAVLAFLRNEIGAIELARRLDQLHENYPPDNFYSELNLLGSHDRERLFTSLGGAPDPDTLSDEERRSYRLTDEQAGLATSRLWAAALLQMTMPGVPSVYYGDEWGMEGMRDPYNRGPFPWEGGRADCYTIYRNAIALRKTLPALVDGDFDAFAPNDDVFGIWRRSGDTSICVLINGSLSSARTIHVPMIAEDVSDVVSGRGPKVENGAAEVFLWPLGTSVLHFHKKKRLQKPLEPGMGVLCHITSVPNEDGPGTLGAPARRFVDWLAACGQTYWQVLPVNPADEYGSPYAGLAAFAGNVELLEHPAEEVLESLRTIGNDSSYLHFCDANEYWLTPYCTFRAIKEVVGDVPWQEWPEKYRRYRPELANDPKLRAEVENSRRLQFEFDREWNDLRAYANERGVKIVGDMPMYVSADSADVWSEPDIFELDEDGYPTRIAGAPGDSFAPEGQLWGNPTFRWDALKEQNYGWWLRRFSRMLSLYDYVRLDHFIGFSSYYSAPAGRPATEGSYAYGPGIELFEAAYQQFGPLPFIAEDLGNITPAVRALVQATGFPGMDVAQFYDGGDVREGYEPKPGTVTYTGTHDNQTLVGWVHESFGLDGEEAREVADGILRRVAGSASDVAIVQLQDVLEMSDMARMNIPGVAEGNWTWQAMWSDVDGVGERLLEIAEESGRARA